MRRAGELVDMCEQVAPMHAICLSRGQLGAFPVGSIETMLRIEREAVMAACADLERTVRFWSDRQHETEMLDRAVLTLVARVATGLVFMLEHARDADAEIDPVLAQELEEERLRWAAMARDPAAASTIASRQEAPARRHAAS